MIYWNLVSTSRPGSRTSLESLKLLIPTEGETRMVLAMDRDFKTPLRRPLFGIGLALACGLVDLGCSELPWRKPSQDPPMLGRVSDTTDIYAMNRRPGGSGVVASSMPMPMSAGVDDQGLPVRKAEVDEVAMAVRPADSSPENVTTGTGTVALKPPTPLESHPTSRVATPSDGVPDASRVLASSERRTTPGSAIQPATLIADARVALDAMTTYEVSLHRQERVNGSLLPEEDVLVAIRRDPRSVRLTWPSGPNQGREVLYRADEPGGSMHVKMANPALPRLSLPPESPMVMRNSRHPVTEAGLDSIVEGLENGLKAPNSDITYAGLETVEGLDQPQHCMTRTSPSGDHWRIYVDPTTHLPSLVLSTDAAGQLLERYLFRDVRPNLPELASKDAFDATARWGQPRGLFGRIARGDATEPALTPR